MIVSHQHKFIFIKTHKVAGTSIEFALTQFAGDDEIVTPFLIKDDERDRLRLGFGGARNHVDGRKTYRVHMGAREVRRNLGRETFGAYFKFCVERNPFDKVVSLYHWIHRKAGAEREDFNAFAASDRAAIAHDWRLYTIRDQPVMDAIVMYDDLQGGLDRVAERLHLPTRIDLSSIRRKSGHRKTPDYRSLYSDASRRSVAKLFAPEIARFGFRF